MEAAPQNKKATKDDKASSSEVNQKYNKLKKRYRQLREEYGRILESWEVAAKSIKQLLEERKFLKKKLETFFKSQHFIDDQIFATAAQPPAVKKEDPKTVKPAANPQQ